jgi:hypothetical protein
LALIAATYLIATVASILHVVGTERINRKTQILLNSPEVELYLTLPKGMWRVGFADSHQDAKGHFEVEGEHSRTSNSDSDGITFHTDKNYTKVRVKGGFEGNFNGRVLELRATF